jgi:threonyl-tRNA synthetase
MVHLGIIGTYERYIAMLLEQTKGVLPLWLSPTQIMILPINNQFHLQYSNDLFNKLINSGLLNRSLGSDIRYGNFTKWR